MTIRRAIADDVPALLDLGVRFHTGSAYRDRFPLDLEQCARTLKFLFEYGAVFVADEGGRLVGMIGGMVTPHIVSGQPIASETFWWVDVDARGIGRRLYLAFEAWGRAQGAQKIQLVAPDERAEQFYQRMGFRRSLETAYELAL